MTSTLAGDTAAHLADLDGAQGVVRSVSWSGRQPRLLVLLEQVQVAVPLLGARLGVRVVEAGRFCTGRVVLDGPAKGHVPCPSGAQTAAGLQCEACGAGDEFRFVHHAHRGGHVPAALEEYLRVPTWVYVASFADGSHKVGTAVDGRQVERLDEQGAVAATFVARAQDGRVARALEDTVTRAVGVTQFKRSSVKARAWVCPLGAGPLASAHEAAVGAALRVVAGSDRAMVTAGPWPWTLPDAADVLADRATPRVAYEPALTAGDHGLRVVSACGSTVLAGLSDQDGDLVVADLSQLRGRRVLFGPYASQAYAVQTSLF